MIKFIIGVVVGMTVGSFVGFFCACLVAANGGDDE